MSSHTEFELYVMFLTLDIDPTFPNTRGGQGVLTPLFLDPPLFICDNPLPTQPDLTDKCNVNCFLIV